MSIITEIVARQILDSRGNPTVEADVYTSTGNMGRAAVPIRCIHRQTRELLSFAMAKRKCMAVKVLPKAVENIEEIIAPELLGFSVFDQQEVDYTMIDLDGTENKEKLGANAILAEYSTCHRKSSGT